MYGVYRDAQLQFNSSTETSTDHNTEPSLDIESMYKDSLYSHQVQFKVQQGTRGQLQLPTFVKKLYFDVQQKRTK